MGVHRHGATRAGQHRMATRFSRLVPSNRSGMGSSKRMAWLPLSSCLASLGCALLLVSLLVLRSTSTSTSSPAHSITAGLGQSSAVGGHAALWPAGSVGKPTRITDCKHVEGAVWGGYWHSATDFVPVTADEAARTKLLDSGSCHQLASQAHEPFTEYYLPRHAQATDLPGGAPRAWHQWVGNITWSDFQRAVPLFHSGITRKKRIIKYKVINNQLYRQESATSSLYSQFAEEMMLVALHLFRVPDTDLAIQYGDSCPFPGVPAIAWGICRNNTGRGGFTMPSYRAWQHALGPHQLRVLHTCFAQRYPQNMTTREKDVVWRGSNTDPIISHFNSSNYFKAARVRIHYMSRNGSKVLNTRLSGLLHSSPEVKRILTPTLGEEMPAEHGMKHAAILDLDGNGWSDRFHTLTHYNTPVLKQASNYTGFFEHMAAAPGHTVHHFANDLSDVQERAQQIVAAALTPSGADALFSQVAHRQGVSAALLDQVAVAEAMAYTMTVYANKTSWKVGSSLAYHPVPWTDCCHLNPSLPKQLVQHVRSRAPPPTMQQLRADGLAPGLEGDAGQPLLTRTTVWLEEKRHRTFYPYLWDGFWAWVGRMKRWLPGT